MSFEILGTGSYVPERVVTNDELSNYVETSDEWIVKRVGIRERRVCTSETTADLGYLAAKNALENSNTAPEDLDLILAATVSGDSVSPSLACMIQKKLGATCPAYDVNAACSAFLFLLETAAGYFARKKVKKVLVVGAERMSRIVDWEDRSTCVIFGDGAGAAVLGEGEGYLSSKLFSDGGDDVICIPTPGGKSPFYQGEETVPYVMMKGQETFKFAVGAMCRDVLEVMEDAGISKEELAYIIPHQANQRILDFAGKRLGIPMEKIFMNIDRLGNTSSASIPIAIDELNRNGQLKKGDLVVLTAFGGGLSSAACVIRW
ncbi:MAG: ketoacyl-ACP synthase III [Ruminococcaceae bacterium]|nr:ketoacyl-ACP synthase III [Oscillospiraceae bacterium]